MTDVLVIGDIMIDEYVYCDAARISAEAPVPVLVERRRQRHLGGAANVAAHLWSLGWRVKLVGVVGSLRDLAGLLSENGRLEMDALELGHNGRPTTRKTRLIASGQQVARMDTESTQDLLEVEHHAIWSRVVETDLVDVIVVSDYAKGVVHETLTSKLRALRPDATIIVDPKKPNWSAYSGADVITPNEIEWTSSENHDCVPVKIVTQGAQGLTLTDQTGQSVSFRDVAASVVNTVGAGDAVVAGLAHMCLVQRRQCSGENIIWPVAAACAAQAARRFVSRSRRLLRREDLG